MLTLLQLERSAAEPFNNLEGYFLASIGKKS